MNFIESFLEKTFKILHINVSPRMQQNLGKFIKFLFVGLANTIIQFAVYYFIIIVFGTEHYLLGQGLGYLCGVINSYFCNSRLVFVEGKRGISSFVKMCACYICTFFIQTALMYVQVDVLMFSQYVAPVFAIIITTPINFILNKIFAFNTKEHANENTKNHI